MRIGVDARNLVPGLTGIGRYVLEMCRHLALRGHEIVLYLPEKPSVPLPEWAGTVARIGDYDGGARRMIWGQVALPRLAAADDLDIFWGPAHRLPAFLDRHIPCVVTIHDLVWMNAASTMRLQTWLGERVLMKPAIRKADRVVAVSSATADAVRAAFPGAAGKIVVVYPGLTALNENLPGKPFASFAERHRIERPYALFVGTLEPRKNLPRLLEAYARLSGETRENLLLVVAGGQGWRLGDLTTFIAQLGIASSVRLTGYVADSELAGLYANARFLAMPSLYEGFGFPIIEANAVGIPALTSNSSSMPEVGGDAALFVDPADVGAIANAMNRLANDDAQYRQLAQKARPNAARFDWSRSADALLAVFEEALEERR